MLHTCIYDGTQLWVHLSGSLDIEVYISGDVYMESILVTACVISIISCWVGLQ